MNGTNLFDQISNFTSDAFDSIGDFFGSGEDDRIDEDYAGDRGSSFMSPSEVYAEGYVGPDDELSPYVGTIPATLGNIEAYDRSDPYASTQYYGQYDVEFEDGRSYAQMFRDYTYDNLRDLGMGAKTIKAIAGFMQGATRGGEKKQAQAKGRGRIGPGLTTSPPRTSEAGRTSPAKPATSNQRAVQAAISQSNRAQSAARAIANQMARAGTYATNNDIADLISGSTSPKGTKQALPGTRLRQLAIPRTA